MRPSIVRRSRVERPDDADGSIDGLAAVVASSGLQDLSIETAHGKTIVRGVAQYQIDREHLFEAIKEIDGWESKIVLDLHIERTDVRGYHTVREGETLASIAERYLGEESHESAIFEANRDRMNDPDQIMPGQQLLIPWR